MHTDDAHLQVKVRNLSVGARSNAGELREALVQDVFRRAAEEGVYTPPGGCTSAGMRSMLNSFVTHVEVTRREAKRQMTARQQLIAASIEENAAAVSRVASGTEVPLSLATSILACATTVQTARNEFADLVKLDTLAGAIEDASLYLGVGTHCANCGDHEATSARCPACKATACAECLSGAVTSLEEEAADAVVVCFTCATPLPRPQVASVLALTYPAEFEIYAGIKERQQAFALRVEYIAKQRAAAAQSLGQKLITIATEPLTCLKCETPVVLGEQCMHMTCTKCGFDMCGFCLGPSKDCDSYMCRLNPMPSDEGENYSVNRDKTMMVLRVYRSALALAGLSVQARRQALNEVAPTWVECADDRVGQMTEAEPWGWREREVPGQLLYMTPLLRTVLHSAFGGVAGTDQPNIVYRDVLIGDVVRLIDLVVDGEPALSNFTEDVEPGTEDAEFDDVVNRCAGRRGIVTKLAAMWVTVQMGGPGDILTVQWDAVVDRYGADDVLAKCTPSHAGRPSAGDYVLISEAAKEASEEAGCGWHPEMQRYINHWMLVAASSQHTITVTRTYDAHAIPLTAIAGFVPARDALRVRM